MKIVLVKLNNKIVSYMPGIVLQSSLIASNLCLYILLK
jgi:hypothetical protein